MTTDEKIIEEFRANLNPELLQAAAADLYVACVSLSGIYQWLEARGLDKELHGFAHCQKSLLAAINKATGHQI